MFKRLCYLPLLFMFIFANCSGKKTGQGQKTSAQTANPKPTYHISFTKTISFGSTKKQLVGVRGWANVLADEINRVYIPDYRTNVIHVFDSTGQYITKMGGKGKGPGMYQHLNAFQITPDYLYVYGRTLFKITAYSLKDLSYSHTIPLNRNDWKDVENLTPRYIGYREFFVTDDEIFFNGLSLFS